MILGFLFLAAGLTFPEATRGGDVCTAKSADFRPIKQCRPSPSAAFDAVANDYFVWRSDKNTFVWLGKSERGGRVAFDPETTAFVSLQVRHADARSLGKSDTTVMLRNASGMLWSVPFDSKKVEQLRTLALPPGRYDVWIVTPGYLTASRFGIVAKAGSVMNVPAIDLDRLPRVSGAIRDAQTGAPVATAEIESDAGVIRSDAQGRFSLSLVKSSEEQHIVVRAPGYATRDVMLQLTRIGSGEIPPILLSHGGSLHLTVSRPDCTADCETTARLFLRRDSIKPFGDLKEVGRKSNAGQKMEYRFDALSKGKYVVLLEGKGPLQRKISTFAIDDGEVTEGDVALQDFVLKGIVTLRNAALANGKLTFSSNVLLWSGELRTNDSGEYFAKLWEAGSWIVKVEVPGEKLLFHQFRQLDNKAEQFWDVSIPTRAIVGRVVDAKSGEPIAGADIRDDISSDRPRMESGRTDDEGKFRFAMLEPSRHTIHVSAVGFLERESHAQIAEGDTELELRIELNRGIQVFYKIVDPQGAPIPNAELYDWVGNSGLENRDSYVSDAWGLVSVPLEPGDEKPVYVMTRSGSFRVVLAEANTKTTAEKPIVITMPAPSASLTVLAKTKSRPAAEERFLVRVDGRFLPPRMWDLITGSFGAEPTRTDQNGRLELPALPPGTYEFWPYRSLEELHALFRTIYAKKPARAVLAPGPNVVEINVGGE
ncbi:MAG TPA: carboxypeptidase-like regulatory domain-containing protein [Thermoanaerobaculia bacterium]|nr:carboxypeptidase-like regulatory domain-containing protein [Thermoanaerobaculia bacterium]